MQPPQFRLPCPFFCFLWHSATFSAWAEAPILQDPWAREKKTELKKISSFAIFSSIVCGALLMAAILLSINPLIKALGSTSEIVTEYSRDYLKYIAIGGPMIVTSIAASNLVRGEGAAKESMTGLMIGTITNIVLDPIMILALDMGVGGAAIATVIGNVASVVYYAFYLIKGNSILSCNPKSFLSATEF